METNKTQENQSVNKFSTRKSFFDHIVYIENYSEKLMIKEPATIAVKLLSDEKK